MWRDKRGVGVFSCRSLNKDDEITVDYGQDAKVLFTKCNCSSKDCKYSGSLASSSNHKGIGEDIQVEAIWIHEMKQNGQVGFSKF